MGLVTWILIGLVAGFLAQLVMGGVGGVGLRGLVMMGLLGVVGAVVGGFLSTALGYGDVTGFNVRSVVIAVIGAIVVLLVYRMLNSDGRRGLA